EVGRGGVGGQRREEGLEKGGRKWKRGYGAMSEWTNPPLSRRACLSMLAAAVATWSATARAQASKSSFDQWVAAFRARAHARGISDATYTRVMGNIKPHTTVFDLI